MKINSIQNIYSTKCNFPKVSFKSGYSGENNNEQTTEKESDKDRHIDTYNKEYKPVVYNKIFTIKAKPMELPSQRMFKYHKNTLRENELFYDDIDSIDFVSTKYDDDDVPIDSNLLLQSYGQVLKTYAPDTLVSEFYRLNDAVCFPWLEDAEIKERNELEDLKDYVYRILRDDTNISYKEMKDLFKSSSLITNGKEKLNYNLCNLAVKIYLNSKVWDETEKAIMDEIRIPIYKKVYGSYFTKKFEYANKCIMAGYTNEETLNSLREIYPGYILDLKSIMPEEDKEIMNN